MSISSNVVVRFDREAGEVELDPAREYRVSVDGGPYSVFRTPWNRARLEELLASLRNTTDDRPDMKSMRQIGLELGEAIYAIKGLPALLVPGTIVSWQLDYASPDRSSRRSPQTSAPGVDRR